MHKERVTRPGSGSRTDVSTPQVQRKAAGKVTRTSKLSRDRAPAIQRKASVADTRAPARDAREQSMDSWMDMAHRGLSAQTRPGPDAGPDAEGSGATPAPGGGSRLSAAVQAKMEQSFGADLSAVRIHEGPDARAMGALAYAQGTHIHFAPGQYDPGSQRGQELLGHELAHVVQQAQGRVPATAQAKGMNINDDSSLEREADEMGARAARGERASGSGGAVVAPGGSAAPGGRAPVAQGFFEIAREDLKNGRYRDEGSDEPVERGVDVSGGGKFHANRRMNDSRTFLDDKKTNIKSYKPEKNPPDLRVSDSCQMAIESTDLTRRQPKVFFATDAVLERSIADLAKTGSHFTLEKAGGSILIEDHEGNKQTLHRIHAVNKSDDTRGNTMTSPQNCDQMAEWVTGWESLGNQRPILGGEKQNMIWEQDIGHQAAAFMLAHQSTVEDDEAAWEKAALESEMYSARVSEVEVPKVVTNVRVKIRTEKKKLAQLQADLDEMRVLSIGRIVGKKSVTTWLTDDQARALEDKGYAVEILETLNQPVKDKETKAAAASFVTDDVGARFTKMMGAKEGLAEQYGINEHAVARVGDAFVTFSLGARDGEGKVKDFASGGEKTPRWGEHWGGVVATDGGDYITLENYARKDEDNGNTPHSETRAFFQMYGSKRDQTWHEQHVRSGEFANPLTLSFANKNRAE